MVVGQGLDACAAGDDQDGIVRKGCLVDVQFLDEGVGRLAFGQLDQDQLPRLGIEGFGYQAHGRIVQSRRRRRDRTIFGVRRKDQPSQIAFDLDAPQAERYDANAELAKAYRPLRSALLPPENIQPVIDYIRGQYEEESLRKAQVIPFPGRAPASRGKKGEGKQSVHLDGLQIQAYGDYWEKPNHMGFDVLRQMVEQTPVLNSVIMTRIRQISRFTAPQEDDGPGFTIRHVDPSHELSQDEEKSVELLKRFIRNCGWEFKPRQRKRLKRDSFTQFMSKSIRDTLTLDSAPIETEMKRNRNLGIDGFYAVDGATVRLCSERGYQGDDEIFALQVVQGSIVTAYNYDELIYEVRNPRTDVNLAGYGMGETELLVRVVTGFLNAMTYNIKGFDENAIPKGLLHLFGDYDANDLASFKRYWNAMVRGVNNAWALPMLVAKDKESGASFEPFNANFDEMYFSKWMTFLTSIICAIYGMDPTEINFESFAANKSALSGSDTEERLADSKDKGLRPLLSYYENLFSDFIISDFSENFCFRWTGLDEGDLDKRHELKKLTCTVDEVRAEEGRKPLGGEMGGAPLNPSLMTVYQQSLQPEEDFGQPDGQDGGALPGAGGGQDDDERDAGGERDNGDRGKRDDKAGADGGGGQGDFGKSLKIYSME